MPTKLTLGTVHVTLHEPAARVQTPLDGVKVPVPPPDCVKVTVPVGVGPEPVTVAVQTVCLLAPLPDTAPHVTVVVLVNLK